MSKRWINTSVEYQWSDELSKLVQISKEGYWYEGEMALCDVTHTGIVTIHTGGTDTYAYLRGYSNHNHSITFRAGKSYATSGTGFMTAGNPHVQSFVEHCYTSQSDSGWHWISSNGNGLTGGSNAFEKAAHLTAVNFETFFSIGIKASGAMESGGNMICRGGTVSFAGSSGNVHFLQPNNNDMRFETNGTETFRIEGGGNSCFVRGKVGIGETSPDGVLHLKAGSGNHHLVISAEDNSASRAWALSQSRGNLGHGVLGLYPGTSQTGAPGTTSMMCFEPGGNVGINVNSPSYKLEVGGTFYASGSSIEYKEDVEPYTPPEGALMSLKPVQYKYKDAWKDFGKRYAGNSSKQLGFVAEDVAKVLPELAVTKTEDGKEVVRNVDYEKLTVLLVSEVQSLRKELTELKINNL